MTKQQIKGLVEDSAETRHVWATVRTPIGTRTTSRLNPQTLNPKNIIIVASTRTQARELQRAINAPETVRALTLNDLDALAGRVYGVQAVYWHPSLTSSQLVHATMRVLPTMHGAIPLLPENFYPLEGHEQP